MLQWPIPPKVINFEGEYPYHGSIALFSVTGSADEIPGDIEITEETEESVIQRLKREGKNVWIIGGGATNARIRKWVDRPYGTDLSAVDIGRRYSFV